MRILLVDDDTEFRCTIHDRLQQLGHRVFNAVTTIAAIELAERERIEVALIDLLTPGMDGIEFLEAIKAAASDCEVVLLTDKATVETAVLAMRRGAFDCLTKPRPFDEVKNILNKAYEHYWLGQESRQLQKTLERTAQSEETLANVERRHVESVLQCRGYNRVRTAQTLGISRRSLYRLIAKHGIQTPDRRSGKSGNTQ